MTVVAPTGEDMRSAAGVLFQAWYSSALNGVELIKVDAPTGEEIRSAACVLFQAWYSSALNGVELINVDAPTGVSILESAAASEDSIILNVDKLPRP